MASRKHLFRRRPVATATAAIAAQLFVAGHIHAGVGFVDTFDTVGQPSVVQTYFSQSPSGLRQATTLGAGGTLGPGSMAQQAVEARFPGYTTTPGAADTGKALRKFVDPLAPLGPFATTANSITANPANKKYMPLAQPEKWISPSTGLPTADDYLELAAVEFREQFHSDLPMLPATGHGSTLADPARGTDIGFDVGLNTVNPWPLKAAMPAKGGTTVRGYVQLVSPNMELAVGAHTWAAGMTEAQRTALLTTAGYKPLYYPDGTRIQVWDCNLDGSPRLDANGKRIKKNAWAVDDPHYLGPAVLAVRGIPTRVKFYNLLPVGRAELDPTSDPLAQDGQVFVKRRNGGLSIPNDMSLMGAGHGPDGTTAYSQNRISVHLHGGDTPWVSDGTAHQWFTPIGEEDPAHTIANGFVSNSLASEGIAPDLLPGFLRGASYANVPDMYEPGPGAMTFYYVNGQGARLMWYHDHAVGATRTNAYMGLAAGYWLTDAQELTLMAPLNAPVLGRGTVIPGLTPNPNPTGLVDTTPIARSIIPGLQDTIPLVVQEKSFIPKDIALQDSRWNATAWGSYGDFFFPNVYETVQDPNQLNNWNAVGRWHYGAWFWPVFPALYPLPGGTYGDETTTPEAWGDTAVINGVAYPYIEVDPKPYRFRLLNGSNDRFFSLSFFQGDPNGAMIDSVGNVGSPADPVTSARTWVDGNGAPVAAPVGAMYPTDVIKIPAAPAANPCLNGETRYDQSTSYGPYIPPSPGFPFGQNGCTPFDWPTDGRNGGVPAPETAGPAWHIFGNEGGFLAKLFIKDPLPFSPLYDVGRATVLNVNTTGLYLANAERSDAVVDFSAYAGKTLILYNDMNAPVPAGDPRNAYFTGVGDQSAQGGAEDTLPGYGPNTQTLMQVRVRAVAQTPGITFNPALLATELPKAYAASQEPPVVAQSVYNSAFKPGCAIPDNTPPGTPGCWDDVKAYASIYTGSIKSPRFEYVPGHPNLFDAVSVTNVGSGYITAPTVQFSGGTLNTALVGRAPQQAAATATLKMGTISVVNPGKGYTVAPAVAIAANRGGGGGAQARTTLTVPVGAGLTTGAITITNGGSGYAVAPIVSFSRPQEAQIDPATGLKTLYVPAAGTAVIDPITKKVTDIIITNGGSGYTAAPTITLSSPGVGGIRATAVATGSLEKFILMPPDPTNPSTAGGGGYTDFTGVTITVTPPTGTMSNGTAAVTATGVPLGVLYDITLTNPGDYDPTSALPTVTLVGGGGAGATAAAGAATYNPDGTVATTGIKGMGTYLVKAKAIQELFEPTHGRLNATLGVELPFTSAVTQTTIPLFYIDPPTEFINDFETQIWKITHNGVDSHPVHFHLMNVQIINRVGWDGFVDPPKPHEIGWKETVVMNPLEDIILAMRPKQPNLNVVAGFGLPQSVRPMDPAQPLGSPFGFTQLNVNTGLPAPVVNAIVNFGWEYTWHCHILGHEENDFMRPLVFNIHEAPANPPVMGTAPGYVPPSTLVTNPRPGGMQVVWTDASSTEYQQQLWRAEADPALTGNACPVVAPADTQFVLWKTMPANVTQTIDPFVDGPWCYSYKVTAVAAQGAVPAAAPSPWGMTPALPPAAPTLVGASQSGTQVALSWTDNSATEQIWWVIQEVLDPTTGAVLSTTPPAKVTSTTRPNKDVIASTSIPAVTGRIRFSVAADSNPAAAAPGATTSAFVAAAPVDFNGLPASPTSLTIQTSETQVVLGFTDAANNESGFRVEMANVTAKPAVPTWTTVTTVPTQANIGAQVAGVVAPVANGNSYLFRICPIDGAGAVSATQVNCLSSTTVPIMFRPAVPTNVTGTISMLGTVPQIKVGWTDNSTNEWTFRAEYSTNGGLTWANVSAAAPNTASTTPAATGTAYTVTMPTAAVGSSYLFRVNSQNAATTAALGTNASAVSLPVVVLPSIALPATLPAPTASSQVLNWTIGNVLPTQTQIERRQIVNGVAGAWTVLATTAAGIKTYTALGLTANKTYEFRLTPKYVSGLAAKFGSPVVVSVVTPGLPVAPTLAVPVPGAKGLRTCTLSWTSNNASVSSWRVQACAEVATAAVPACNNTTSVWTAVTNPVPAVTATNTAASVYSMSVTIPTTKVLPSKMSYRVMGVAGTLPGAPSNVQMCTYQ
jgi:FtsP/CotA-like multicopper oxidase with cupredoxin domain